MTDPDEVIRKACGPINKDLLCYVGPRDGSSTAYLHDGPVISHLRENESLQYLFSNRSEGLEITEGSSRRSLEVNDEYHSVMALTSERLLWIIGQSSGDLSVEVSLDEVEDITLDGDTLEVGKSVESLIYTVENSDVASDAVEYIRTRSPQLKLNQQMDTKDSQDTHREDLISEIKSLTERLGRVPSYTDMDELGEYEAKEYTYEFQSWRHAVEAAGFEMRERLIADLHSVSEQVGRPPTISDVEEFGKYGQSRYDSHFDSWSDAIEAATDTRRTKQELADEIHRLRDELARVPTTADVENHSEYSTRHFTLEFGSVPQAIDSLGLSYREDVVESIRDVAKAIGSVPKTADFDEYSPYSNAIIYREFDDWNSALQTAGVDTQEAVDQLLGNGDEDDGSTTEADQKVDDETVEPNPLAEHYESFRMLWLLQEALFDGSPSQSIDPDDPMAQWSSLVKRWVNGDGPTENTESYGSQQNEQNEITMSFYRDIYGNGDFVTDFQTLDTEPLADSIRWLVESIGPSKEYKVADFRIPIAPDSEEPLPVVVETYHDLTRARQLLNEFPAQPSIPSETRPTDDPPGSEPSNSGGGEGEITEISGITKELASTLIENGYDSTQCIAEADIQEIAELLGVSQVKAARIIAAAGD